MEQNKVSSYFLYAIGEIALVMIGILLALQVNNWNENRKLKAQKAILLENLQQDFEENLNRLDLIISFLDDRQDYARQILYLLETLPEEVDSIPTVFALERAGFVHFFNPTQPTYEEMKSSGTLSLISNKELKRVMSSYQTFLEYTYRLEEKNSDIIQSFADRILRYMDPDFGNVNISDNDSKAYAGVHFDLKTMSNDSEIRYLLKTIIQKSISEASYKDRIFRSRINYILKLIKEERDNLSYD
jgi:hypothetical protein